MDHVGSAVADEIRLLRDEVQRCEETLARLSSPDVSISTGVRVGVTQTLTSYPTTANAFYGIKPVTITGAENEGSPGSLAVSSETYYAYNIGSTIPPVGTSVEIHRVAHCNVFRYDA